MTDYLTDYRYVMFRERALNTEGSIFVQKANTSKFAGVGIHGHTVNNQPQLLIHTWKCSKSIICFTKYVLFQCEITFWQNLKNTAKGSKYLDQ